MRSNSRPSLPYLQYYLLLACLSWTLFCCAQKYNFAHYDIENGLVQSQALKICQDRTHNLWIGTYGGVSSFDGKEFKNYIKSDGLADNTISSVFCDRNGRTWLGTEDGISFIAGSKIKNLRIPDSISKAWVRTITQSPDGTIWFVRKSRLFKITGGRVLPSPVGSSNEYVLSLGRSRKGIPYAAVYGQGIYSLKNNKWVKIISPDDAYKNLLVTRIIEDRFSAGRLYLLTPKKILVAENGKVKPYRNTLIDNSKEPLFCLEQDAEGNLWAGTNNGAYYLKPGGAVHFTSGNGFMNGSVNDIYKDSEDNIWLATDGAGVFKYDGNTFTSFDRINGNTQIIMGLARDDNNHIWMGTFNNGLIKYDGKKFSHVFIPSANMYTRSINCIYNENNKSLLIGTLSGLWRYKNKHFTYLLARDSMPEIVRAVFTDHRGIIWMAAPRGCFYFDGRHSYQVRGLNYTANTIIPLGKDSVLAGTDHGIALIKNKIYDPHYTLGALGNLSVICLLRYRNTILAGTIGDGLYIFDLHLRTFRKYTAANGLYSNDIYSLAADESGVIWAGTGRGVNRFTLNSANLSVNILADLSSKALIECNQNSILNMDKQIWVGSTKGLFIFNTRKQPQLNKRPWLNIQSVKIFSQEKGKLVVSKTYHTLPGSLQLGYKENRILITFRGIYFTNPDDVVYQYRLKGLDDNFSQPIQANAVEYPSLPPGSYTFEVKAINSSGTASPVQSLAFHIRPPLYQTTGFKLLAVLLLISAIIALQYYWNYRGNRQKMMVEKIKTEEQLKIRRQTAEDFHDDIGNKITRISVLSDILTRKIGGNREEQQQLICQIKENAAILYRGTKDILWALDPQSDNLYEILTYIKDSGNDIFHHTGILFIAGEAGPEYQKLHLPMEYSRNISMIFKELMNNILKHAGASQVTLNHYLAADGITITLTDDGTGFNSEEAHKGRGLNNIRLRAARINGSIRIDAQPGRGTSITLFINLVNSITGKLIK